MKIISAEEREAKASRYLSAALSPREEAIREKHLAPYVPLVCGHLTTREEIESNSVWQTKPGRFYCCNCGKWQDMKKRQKPPPLPDEPLF